MFVIYDTSRVNNARAQSFGSLDLVRDANNRCVCVFRSPFLHPATVVVISSASSYPRQRNATTGYLYIRPVRLLCFKRGECSVPSRGFLSQCWMFG